MTMSDEVCLALSLCAALGIAGCTSDGTVDPAASCGPGMDTPCCSDELISEVDIGPVIHAEITAAAVVGNFGIGVLDSVDAAAADANCTGPLPSPPHECRSSWSLTMRDGSTTGVNSSLPVEDIS